LALWVWVLSWAILHGLWRKRHFSLEVWMPLFLGILLVVTLCFFHPLVDPVVLFVAGLMGLA